MGLCHNLVGIKHKPLLLKCEVWLTFPARRGETSGTAVGMDMAQ